ncbi:MAG: LVIVD repeat-containing protein, partial [Gaiellaceae bacterium]
MSVTGRPLVLVALAALVAGVAIARGAHDGTPRFEVLAHVDPGDVYAGDVYAHRDHAYLSSHRARRSCPAQGVRVYDLRNPRRPKLVSRFGSVTGTWTEKTIVKHVTTESFTGDLAVISFQGCTLSAFRGFGLWDVTNPRRPRRLALVPTDPRGSHEIWLGAVGNRAFVYTAIISSEIRSSPDYDAARHTATIPGDADFRIFDVSDPAKPAKVGEWGAWRSLGVHPNDGLGEGRMRQNLVHSVITNRAGTRAYLSYWDLGTVILDISTPARPRYLGRTKFEPGEVGNAHSAALGRNETLLLQTHETDGGIPVLFDVSNPAAPRRLSEF